MNNPFNDISWFCEVGGPSQTVMVEEKIAGVFPQPSHTWH